MKAPLLIQINYPCAENWDEMTPAEQGKFCSHCQKTVIDFSEKTDAELIEFFNTHTSFCGRFKHTQIGRVIVEPKPVLKRLFYFYSKTAAFIFTVFSFKSYQIHAQTNKPAVEQFAQSADEIHSGKITIEGTITDDENRSIDSADVFFDHVKMCTSKQDGYYQFKIENCALKNHVISFSKNQYRSFSFSFHPLMGNSKQDVVMCNYKDKECFGGHHLMGAPVMPHFENFQFPISKSMKSTSLNLLAIKLRQNPWTAVSLKLYFSKESEKKYYEKKAQEIINYLIDKQGIDRERLHLSVHKNAGKENIVEVSDYSNE